MTGRWTDACSRALVCVALVGLVAVVYAQTARFDFISVDDSSYIHLNPHVRTGLNWDNVIWSISGARAANWHPLTWTSHMVDVSLFGLHAGGHHITSAVLHAVNSVLLFLLLAGLTGSTWRGAFVAAMFAAHPINVESVAWIAERKNVLSTLFWILTMMAYVRYVRSRESGCGGWPIRYAVVLALFALGLMAKPMLVTLPIVLLLVDFWPLERFPCAGRNGVRPLLMEKRWGRLVVEKLPMFAMAVASSWITVVVQQQGGMTRPLEQFSMGERVANMFVAYAGYILKALWPRGLCMLYPHPGSSLPIWQPVVSAAALAVVTWLAIKLRKSAPYLFTGWLWYVVTLVPVIGIVQVGPQAMADRYAYVPLIGIFIVMAWGIPRLVGERRVRCLAAAGVALVIAMTAVSYRQVGYWRDTSTMFRRTLAITHNHLPVACSFVGSMWRAGMMPDAVRVLRGTPDPVGMFNGVGVLLARVGVLPPAKVMYREALRTEPGFAEAHNNLGVLLARQQRYVEAVPELETAVRLKPDYAQAHHNLAVVLYAQGRTREAIAHWKKALEIDPNLTAARIRLKRARMKLLRNPGV